MFCVFCGEPLTADAGWCHQCGRATGVEAPPPHGQSDGEGLSWQDGEFTDVDALPPVAAEVVPGFTDIDLPEASIQPGLEWSAGPVEVGEVRFTPEGHAYSPVWSHAQLQVPPYRRPGKLALALTLALALVVVLNAVGVLMEVERLGVLDDIEAGRRVTLDRAESADDNATGVLGLVAFASVAVAVLTLWWLVRATENLLALGIMDRKHSLEWAIASWFIPVWNLWQPLLVVRQAWQGSRQPAPGDQATDWKRVRVPLLIPVWWVVFVASLVLFVVVLVVTDVDATVQERSVVGWSIALHVVTALAAVLAVFVVRAMGARQERAQAALEVAAWEGDALRSPV